MGNDGKVTQFPFPDNGGPHRPVTLQVSDKVTYGVREFIGIEYQTAENVICNLDVTRFDVKVLWLGPIEKMQVGVLESPVPPSDDDVI